MLLFARDDSFLVTFKILNYLDNSSVKLIDLVKPKILYYFLDDCYFKNEENPISLYPF